MKNRATGLATVVLACSLSMTQAGCPSNGSPSMDALEVTQTDDGKPIDDGKPVDGGKLDDGGPPPVDGTETSADIPVDIPDPECLENIQCDDGTPCTDDQCVDGKCVYQTVPDCCDDDGDCADNDPCTTEKCVVDAGGKTLCQIIPVDDCCYEDGECEDGDPCTDDICADNQCTHVAIPDCGGCQSNEDCDDGDFCTEDECLMDMGPDGEEQTSCANHDIPGCCHDDDDCDQGPACTQGQCVLIDPVAPLYECQYTPLPGCCMEDWQCEDNDPCTMDLCGDDGTCYYVPSPDCCTNNIDCQDFDPCTDDFCDDGMCLNLFKPGCCQTDEECQDDDPCTKDYCQLMSGVMPGMCIHQPDPACTCNDGNLCTEDTMTSDGQCKHTWIPDCCNTVGDCLMGNLCAKAECIDHVCIYEPFICDDNDPCTVDSCDAATGQCIHTPLSCDDGDACTKDQCDSTTGDCVHETKACNDGNDCTKDSCDESTGQCAHFWLPWCCQGDGDCDDANPCTVDACVGHQCQTSPKDCDDGKPCSKDLCDPTTGDCYYVGNCNDGNACTYDFCDPAAGYICKHGMLNCNDGDDCTLDACDPDLGCVYTLDPNCVPQCLTNADCDDQDPCTDDECVESACNNWWNEDCCKKDADCDDGNPCTTDTCGGDQKCTNAPNTNPCDDGDPCTEANTCENGTCSSGSPKDCNDDDDCTVDTCDPTSGACTNEPITDCCQPTDTWLADFKGGAEEGFSFVSKPSNVKWQVWDSRFHSPKFALYFGDPDTLTYADPELGVVSGAATSPPITVPAAPASLLTFWTFVDVETIPQYDTFTVTIHADDGDHVVWNKSILAPGQFEVWTEVSINVTPYQGQDIKVTFAFDSLDHLHNQTEGVYVDDVSVESVCEALHWCQTDDECQDDNPCTKDLCTGNTCIHEVILGCCLGDEDCNDKYPCTVDECVDNSCLHDNIPGCCVDSAECDDGNPCTKDLCDNGQCAHEPADGPDCCETAADCDDGDACTTDTCEAHLCTYEPTPDCCIPGDAFFQNFPVNSLGGFTVVDDGSQVKWQVDNFKYFDEPFALYYGNPETRNYDNGTATYGTATSPTFQVPPYGTPMLTFQTYLDVEVGAPYDNLRVYVQTETSKLAVWSKGSLTDPGVYQTWTAVSVDLSEFAGEVISLIFEFDSVDGNLNNLEGVYLDVISVDVTCPAP